MLIISIVSQNIYIGRSSIKGNGLIAKKNFKNGDIVFILKGKIKRWLVKDKKTSMTGPNWIGIAHNVWIDPAYPFMYLNHSCDPNIGIKGKVIFVALRGIKKGEEVAFDYSTTEDDVLWQLPFRCKCGSKSCRSKIKSIQFLPIETYNKYLPCIPEYFKKVYNENHGFKSNG